MNDDITILKKRFRSYIEVDSNECWIWQGTLCRGYAIMRVGERSSVRVIRWIYELLIGPIPEGHELHHACLIKACVNPFHLEPMTHKRHAQIHGKLGSWNGERNSQAKLTEAEVLEIRKLWQRESYSAQILAEQFNVSLRTIYNCINYDTYFNLVPELFERSQII